MINNEVELSRLPRTSGKASPIQSIPGTLEVFSKGMISKIRLERIVEKRFWAHNGRVTATERRTNTKIVAGLLKLHRLYRLCCIYLSRRVQGNRAAKQAKLFE